MAVESAYTGSSHLARGNPVTAPRRLALRPKDAALALGIGERLLWSKTNAGEIPHVRIVRAVVYPVDLLRDWLTEQALPNGAHGTKQNRNGVRSNE